MRRKKINLDELELLCKEPSATYYSIAGELGVDYYKLRKCLEENNLRPARYWCPSEDELYEICDKKNLIKIASERGLKPKTIANRLKKAGLSYSEIRNRKVADLKSQIEEMLADGLNSKEISGKLGWNSSLYRIHKVTRPIFKKGKSRPKLVLVDKEKLNYAERYVYEGLFTKHDVWRCRNASCDFFLKDKNTIIEVKSGGRNLAHGIVQLLFADYLFQEYFSIKPKKKYLAILKMDKHSKQKFITNRFLYKYFADAFNIFIVDKRLKNLF